MWLLGEPWDILESPGRRRQTRQCARKPMEATAKLVIAEYQPIDIEKQAPACAGGLNELHPVYKCAYRILR